MKSFAKTLSEESRVLALEWNAERNNVSACNVSSRDSFRGSWWICSVCGYEWQQAVNRRVDGLGCRVCADKNRGKILREKIVEKKGSVSDNFPELLEEWCYDLNSFSPNVLPSGSRERVWWKCKACGFQWETTVESRTRLNSGCKKCVSKVSGKKFAEKVVKNGGSLLAREPGVAAEWNFLRNDFGPETVAPVSGLKVWWLCGECAFEWEALIANRTSEHNRNGCPKCSLKFSKLEKIFGKFLESVYGGLIVMNSFPLILDGRRLQLDFWLPDLGIAFEVQDFATHSMTSDDELLERQFLKWALNSGDSVYKKGPSYHDEKRRLAREQLNTELFDVWENIIVSGRFEELEKMVQKFMVDKNV